MIHVNARAIIERETAAGVEIVVQTRDKPPERGRFLELPGGRVEPFEALIEALTREVREETGLELTHVEGAETRVETTTRGNTVECLRPFAVFQTTRGPVDVMGVYFRCRAEGEPLTAGHETKDAHWMPVVEVAQRMAAEPEAFMWADRAGLAFYLEPGVSG
jgi:8-oxo-dGTP diphosphatase